MTRVTFVKGVVVASLAAGPIFVTALLRGAPFADRGGSALAAAPFIYGVSLFYGFVISLVPNMIGAMSLATLGRRARRTRAPLIWAAVGGGAGTALQFAFMAMNDQPPGPPVMTLVGAACALICRWGTHWND